MRQNSDYTLYLFLNDHIPGFFILILAVRCSLTFVKLFTFRRIVSSPGDKMGCDGGTIPRRDELVKVKRKKEAVSELNYREGVFTGRGRIYFAERQGFRTRFPVETLFDHPADVGATDSYVRVGPLVQ